MLQDGSSNEGQFWARDKSASEGDTPVDSSILPRIADHTLLRRIGRGSYGEVWLARHVMGMFRAVKVVHRRFFQDHRPFERELSGIQKFEPISRSYEGFIDILHVGINEAHGYFYYVMELGDDQTTGPNIDADLYVPRTLTHELSRRGTLDYQSCLQLGLDLSRALAQLHENGLVHRDIKPSNILFVNGVPKLADIGLVTQADAAHSYVGTEGFIPPEGPGTAQADVYALGKVLYEAITGKDRQDYPELPIDWDGRPGHEQLHELNEIILHACSNDAKTRYRTAKDIHADLVVLLAGKSVRRLKSLERQLSRIKRIGSISALISIILGTILYLIYSERSMAAKMRVSQVANLVAHGNSAMDSGDLTGALPYFAQALEFDKGNKLRALQHQLRSASIISLCPKIVQMEFDTNEIVQVDLSPDGQKILTVEWMGQAQIFDFVTGKPLTAQFGQSSGIRRGTFSSDGSLVVTASEDNSACVWRSTDGTQIQCLAHSARVLSAAFSPDDRQIVTGCTDSRAWVWEVANWMPRLRLAGHTNAVLFATFSHDGKLIATGSRDYTARLWDATTGQQIGEPLPHPNWVQFIAFSPDDQKLVTGCDDHKARVWNIQTHERIPPDLNHDEVVSCTGFSPDGRLIITGSFDGTARLWSALDHQPFMPAPILRHSDRVRHVAFADDGHRIVTGCVDGTVRVWDLAGTAVPSALASHGFSQDLSRFLIVSNGTVQVWDTASQQPVSALIRPLSPVFDSALSTDGHFALSLARPVEQANGVDASLEIWESQTGKRIGPAIPCTNAIENARVSTDGKRLLIFKGSVAQTFDVLSGNTLASWRSLDGPIHSALFSPSGNAVASWSEKVLAVRDATTGRMLFPTVSHTFPIKDVQFSRDGLKLVTCGADTSLTPCYAQVWDARSGKPIGPQLMHGDGVLCSTFSEDSRLLLTGGEDSKAIVWDGTSGNQITFIKHKDKVMRVVFSADATSFLTASLDKTARVWTSDTGDPLTPLLRHHAKLMDATFLANDGHLIVTDSQGRAWVWQLSQARRTMLDLLRVSHLLSGAPVIPLSAHNLGAGEALKQTWKQLQIHDHPDVEVSPQEIASWYEFQEGESELEGNWSAAAFYLHRLLLMRPGDRAFIEHLTRINTHKQGRN